MKSIGKLLSLLFIIFLLNVTSPLNQLLFAVPLPPKLNISTQILNFDRCTKDAIPVLKFTISNQNEGPIKVTIKPSQNWIQLSAYSFEGHEQEINVSIDPTTLSTNPGFYLEKIEIELEGSTIALPVRLDLVEKRVIIKMELDSNIINVNGSEYGKYENDGKYECFAPLIKHGRIYIPLRIILESFGAKVDFVHNEMKVIIGYRDITCQFIFYSTKFLINGQEVMTEYPPIIMCGRTKVPFKTLQAILPNINIIYVAETRSIIIEY